MSPKISFVILILFCLIRRHSVEAFASRHAVIIVQPPSRIARNSYLFGGHLEGRSGVCPSGYDPCGSDSCCPPGCISCNDNTNTCCDIGQCPMLLLCSSHPYFLSGTFCTYNGTKPVCECFGTSCPGGNTPPPTSSTQQPTTTSQSTFYAPTFSSVFDPFTSTTTSSTSTGLTTGPVGFSSTTTPLSIPTSSVAPFPSTTTSASGSSSGNAGGNALTAAAVDFKPPLWIALGMGIVPLVIGPCGVY